jgi:spermidine synthase
MTTPDSDFGDSRPFTETHDLKPYLHTDEDSVSMQFDMATIQSRMILSDPTALDLEYSRAMMAFLLLEPQPQSVLMIGLGGGSLPKYVHQHWPQADITVVEINPHVIDMRDAFHVPPDGERFRVVCGDGAAFMAKAQPTAYDVILVDGFSYEGQPQDLCSIAFYKACRKALRASGVLVVNLQDQEPECSRLLGRIWQVFGEAVVPLEIECGGNLIALASTEDVFKQCATSFGRRWSELPQAHQATLDMIRPALEEELKPWRPASSTKVKPKPSR